jgi:hypothetical protein
MSTSDKIQSIIEMLFTWGMEGIDAKELLRMGGPIIMSILPATHTEKNLFLKMEIKEGNEYKISLGFDGYDPDKKNPPDKMFG